MHARRDVRGAGDLSCEALHVSREGRHDTVTLTSSWVMKTSDIEVQLTGPAVVIPISVLIQLTNPRRHCTHLMQAGSAENKDAEISK